MSNYQKLLILKIIAITFIIAPVPTLATLNLSSKFTFDNDWWMFLLLTTSAILLSMTSMGVILNCVEFITGIKLSVSGRLLLLALMLSALVVPFTIPLYLSFLIYSLCSDIYKTKKANLTSIVEEEI